MQTSPNNKFPLSKNTRIYDHFHIVFGFQNGKRLVIMPVIRSFIILVRFHVNFGIFLWLVKSFSFLFGFRENILIYMKKVNVSHFMPYFHLIEKWKKQKKKKYKKWIFWSIFFSFSPNVTRCSLEVETDVVFNINNNNWIASRIEYSIFLSVQNFSL